MLKIKSIVISLSLCLIMSTLLSSCARTNTGSTPENITSPDSITVDATITSPDADANVDNTTDDTAISLNNITADSDTTAADTATNLGPDADDNTTAAEQEEDHTMNTIPEPQEFGLKENGEWTVSDPPIGTVWWPTDTTDTAIVFDAVYGGHKIIHPDYAHYDQATNQYHIAGGTVEELPEVYNGPMDSPPITAD